MNVRSAREDGRAYGRTLGQMGYDYNLANSGDPLAPYAATVIMARKMTDRVTEMEIRGESRKVIVAWAEACQQSLDEFMDAAIKLTDPNTKPKQ